MLFVFVERALTFKPIWSLTRGLPSEQKSRSLKTRSKTFKEGFKSESFDSDEGDGGRLMCVRALLGTSETT